MIPLHMGSRRSDALLGKRFNRLVVLRHAERPSHFVVQCDCGTVKEVGRTNLVKNMTKSCGCYRRENTYHLPPKPTAAGNSKSLLSCVISNYTNSAKRRGIPWALTRDEVDRLIGMNCHYCDAPPSNRQKINYRHTFSYTGIDRISHYGGYTPDNVVPCCRDCNQKKHQKSYGEFVTNVAVEHPEELDFSRYRLSVEPYDDESDELLKGRFYLGDYRSEDTLRKRKPVGAVA